MGCSHTASARKKSTVPKYDPPYAKKPIAKTFAGGSTANNSQEDISMDGGKIGHGFNNTFRYVLAIFSVLHPLLWCSDWHGYSSGDNQLNCDRFVWMDFKKISTIEMSLWWPCRNIKFLGCRINFKVHFAAYAYWFRQVPWQGVERVDELSTDYLTLTCILFLTF